METEKQRLFNEMKTLWEELQTEHEGTTKASQTRARKAANELKKLITPYKKASVEESK